MEVTLQDSRTLFSLDKRGLGKFVAFSLKIRVCSISAFIKTVDQFAALTFGVTVLLANIFDESLKSPNDYYKSILVKVPSLGLPSSGDLASALLLPFLELMSKYGLPYTESVTGVNRVTQAVLSSAALVFAVEGMLMPLFPIDDFLTLLSKHFLEPQGALELISLGVTDTIRFLTEENAYVKTDYMDVFYPSISFLSRKYSIYVPLNLSYN